MAYRLDPTLGTAPELRRVLADQLGVAVEKLRVEGGPDAEAIHDVRKHLKKARSALRLARGDLGRGVVRHANAVLRDCGQELSSQRDADAMVETAERLREPAEEAGPTSRTAVDALHRAVAERADAERTGAGSVRVTGVAVELDRLDRWLALVAPQAEGWEALAPGVRRQYGRGADALASLGDAPTDEQLHDWRKRAKDLWYHLRLLRDLWPESIKPLVKAASHLADLLGDDHDLAVLAALLRPDEDGVEPPMPPVDLPAEQVDLVDDLIATERARLQSEARRLGALLYADSPRAWTDRHGAWWRTATVARSHVDAHIAGDDDSEGDADEQMVRASA
jgi:CHAD domain-containing protein